MSSIDLSSPFHGTVLSSHASVMTPLTSSGRVDSRAATAEWATVKLPFETLGIYGRNREMLQLQRAVSRLVRTNNDETNDVTKVTSTRNEGTERPSKEAATKTREIHNKELILVSGYSGTGKTTLVTTSIEEVTQDMGGVFAVGKFDQCLGNNQQQRPFTAFGRICQVLAQQIVNLKRKDSTSTRQSFDSSSRSPFEQLKDTVMMELSTELIDLIQVFPSLDVILSTMDENGIKTHDQILDGSSSSMTDNNDQSTNASLSSYGSANSESRHRLIYAFRVLLRIVSAYMSPMVFVLDDMQWADTSSLDLLEGLLSDQEIKQMMFVGIYRSNEVDETHILSKTLRDIHASASENDVQITEMEIGNLDVGAVEDILQALLSSQRDLGEEVNRLAAVCHKKTSGNAFYIIHFLSMLQDEHLLTYNNHTSWWEWDIEAIEQATSATQNVVDILKQTISNLSFDDQLLLQFAAYLGSVFDERSIHVLWKDHVKNRQKQEQSGTPSPNYRNKEIQADSTSEEHARVNQHTSCTDKERIRQSLKKSLESCIKSGFFEYSSRQKKYHWVHDKLQEAAMDHVPAQDHRAFSRHVAEVLHSNLTNKEVEAALFVIVNRYNEGTPPTDPVKRLHLARLNLRAANKAVLYWAFESISIYCEYGIKMLPDDRWEKHYRLTLDLFSLGAEAESFLGKVYKMEKYCNEVLRQKEQKQSNGLSPPSSLSVSSIGGVRDKFRVYNVMLDSVYNRGSPKEAADICLDVLSQYGIRLPSNTAGTMARIMYNIGKAKSGIKQRTAEEARNMTRIEDQAHVEQMKLLDRLSVCLYLVDQNLMTLVIFRSFQLTLKYGLCKHSPPTFANVSFIVVLALGDFNGAATYARYALALLDKLDPVEAKQVESRTVFLAHGIVLYLTQPVESILKPLLHGYHVGMQCGEAESAIHCINVFMSASFVSGRNLSAMDVDYSVYVKQMKLHKQNVSMNVCKITWQLILNLMGHSQLKTRLTGHALKEDECRKQAEEDPYLLATLEVHKIILFSIFGEYESGAKLALEVSEYMKVSPGHILIPIDMFHRCLCFLVTAQKLKQEGRKGSNNNLTAFQLGWGMESKYVRLAKQGLAKIKGWTEQGNPNVVHHEFLLKAELAAYQGRSHVARKHYELSITTASKGGFIQDCALANERYGEFWLEQENLQEAQFRIQESIDLYREWGAHGKADSLEKKYSGRLLPTVPSDIKVEVPVPVAGTSSY